MKLILILALFFSAGVAFGQGEEICSMESEQKVIGMIGGASWESTVLYYQLINQYVRDHLGGLNSAKILLDSINYDPIVKLEQEGEWGEVGHQIAKAAKGLQDGGASFLILCCNTLHKVTPAIEEAIDIPFLHIADPARSLLSENGLQKVGLLGTQFTMEDGFYAARLEEKFGLQVILSESVDRQRIDQIIYSELCQGQILPESKAEIIQIINALQSEGAEAILLGCTELGLLIHPEDGAIPIYDTTLLHAHEAARISLLQKRSS